MKIFIKSFIILIACFITIVGYSQKGTGEANGVSRQGLDPELLKMEGVVEKVESGPCKYTTGRSVSGTHLIVQTQDKLINVHLGPASDVSQLVSVTAGNPIAMIVFRTDKLPKDEYIAKEVKVNGKSIVLRDERLKPVWAGGNRKEKWRMGN